MNPLDGLKIEHHDFPKSQYFQTKHKKRQIVLHHTVSPVGVMGDISWWKRTEDRVGTWCIMDHEGTIHRLFSSAEWAHHLGVSSRGNKIDPKYKKNNTKLNRESIGIEIDSVGPLTREGAKWFDDYGRCYEGDVTIYENGYRGYEAYASYSTKQIEALEKLLKYLSAEYDIPLHYYPQMWDICCEALEGEKGVFTHTSYRTDKSDCHPQPELIEMLCRL